jgi:hypothetical protein
MKGGLVPLVGPHAPSASWQDLDGRVVVFNAETGRAAALNETASTIWRLADGQLEEAEVIELLAEAYAVPPERIATDVRHAIETLRSEGLLAAAEPPAGDRG